MTRCDSLLYPSGTAPPTDAEWTTGKVSTIKNDVYSRHRLSQAVRLWVTRLATDCVLKRSIFTAATARTGGSYASAQDSDDPLDLKRSEWNENDPPSERVYDLSAHHFFLNAYYDLRNVTHLLRPISEAA